MIYQDYSEFRAVLYPSGTVKWEPGGVFKTMCTIDITYYPFDEQRCELIFGAWSYYTSKMNLTTNTYVSPPPSPPPDSQSFLDDASVANDGSLSETGR